MASIRRRVRKDGGTTYAVLYTLDGRQSSLSFIDHKAAQAFKAAVDAHGAARALQMHGVDPAPRRTVDQTTVTKWLSHHIDHLTGVDKRTIDDYRSYVRTSIGPVLGDIPLDVLSRDDVARWVQSMEGVSGKTIANKHALLSAALSAAVAAGHLSANPAAGARLPRTEAGENVFLTEDQFASLIGEVPESWCPLVQFLVASGARWGEVTALRPSDVDRDTGTVRISRAWRKNPYRIGPPKTRKSRRTITIDTAVLAQLDYTGQWLFTNPGHGNRKKGGPVRSPNFRVNVWRPAVERAGLNPMPRIHDLRHTCASWMLIAGVPPHVVQRHLGHESIKTTVDRYGPYLDRSSAQQAAKVIGDMLT